MKKTLSFILSLIMVFGILTSVPLTVNAVSVDDLIFTLSDDGTYYSVTGCEQTAEGEMVIPNTYEGLPVAEICGHAFEYCWDIISVIIPDSVTSIAYSSFYECSSLTSITIGKGASYIAECPFLNCYSIISIDVNSENPDYTSVDGVLFNKDKTTLIQYPAGKTDTFYSIPDSVTSLGYEAFHGCTNIISLEIPNSVMDMDQGPFNWETLSSIVVDSDNPNYTSVDGILFNKDKTTLIQYPAGKTQTSYVIPDSVTNIGLSSFYGCNGLTSIVIPEGVTVIDYYAFYNCENLTSIIIPDSVIRISDYAFEWTGYYNYEVNWENGVLYIGNHLIEAQPDIGGSYEIKNGTKSIADGAFRDCTGITSITIPDSVISIGAYAFSGCTSLASISIGAGVKNAGDWIFSGCENLASITIADGVTCISWLSGLAGTIYYNNSENWNNGALYIGNCLFEVDSDFSGSYEIKSGTTTIADRAFDDCWDITSVMIPDSVTNIGDYVFAYWAWDTVYYTGSQSEWDDIVVGIENFYLTQATIHYDVNDIVTHWTKNEEESSCDCTVYSCPCGYEYTAEGEGFHSLSDGVCTICGKTILTFELNEETMEYSVVGCDESVSGEIAIPETYNGLPVTDISEYAFYWCNVTSVKIPDSVTSIGYKAFWGCDGLTTITIPHSVVSIGEATLSYCENLTEINVDSENTCYTSVDGVLFNKEKTILVQYPNGKDTRNYTIPDSVITIGEHAFYDADILDYIVFPDGVITIGEYAFFSCDGLTSIIIPDSVKTINDYAFEYCANLYAITISDNVASIGNEAFLGSGYYEIAENWDNGVLYIGNHLIKAQYDISGSYEIRSGTRTIADYAFSNCVYLATVTIPKSIIGVGINAFRSCQRLNSINVDAENAYYISLDGILFNKEKTTLIKYPSKKAGSDYAIPEGVINIDESAFAYCVNLESIVIPEGVTIIKERTFGNCENLTTVIIPDGLTNIGVEAFEQCGKLVSVTIPDSVISIGAYAFLECNSLESVIIPDSVINLGWHVFGYVCGEVDYERIENFVIYGVEGSRAEGYANENGFSFVEIQTECAHITGEWIVDTPATCTESGLKYKECTECGETVEIEVISATGHTEVKDAAVEATCTETGLTEGSHCSICNVVIKAQTTVPAKGHTEVKDAAIEATCTEAGKTEGSHCSVCNVVIKAQSTVPAKGHTEVKDAAIEATCTEAGKTEGSHCSVCNVIIKAQSTVPAKGHTEVKDAAVAATCTETGLTEGSHCSVCNAVIVAQNTVPATGHTTSEWIIDKDSTCTEEGSQHKECTVCKAVLETQAIDKKEHIESGWKIDKKASVTSAGKKHKECTECGEVLETATIKQLTCSKPKLKTIENTEYGVKITWGKVSGADKYDVYRKTGSSGKYTKIGTTSKTYYTDKKASSGKKYYYYVKAVNEAGSSSASSSLSKLYLADTTLSTPKSTKSGITLKWKKITGADGYMVYRKTGSGSYSKIATVKGSTKVTYTDKSAKKGKTYTYKIKAYKSKTYSAYSNTKKIKDKY